MKILSILILISKTTNDPFLVVYSTSKTTLPYVTAVKDIGLQLDRTGITNTMAEILVHVISDKKFIFKSRNGHKLKLARR